MIAPPSSSQSVARDHAADRSAASLETLARLLAVPGFALLTALGAQVAFPIPPFGVPQTLQTLAVLLCALFLGPRLGSLSMGLYVMCGMIGVPLFADGDAGLATIIGQTGGYLIGFVACQPVAHAIIRKRTGHPTDAGNTIGKGLVPDELRGWGAVVLAGFAVHAVVFLIGVPWLYAVRLLDPETTDLTLWQAIFGGCIVFLPGMVLKTGIATVLAIILRPEVARRVW